MTDRNPRSRRVVEAREPGDCPGFSSPDQLAHISALLRAFMRLPFCGKSVPGGVLESVLAHVRGGSVCGTYDFVDVVDEGSRVGWQVKSTRARTPVTWKRAKIEEREALIRASHAGSAGLQRLGNAIIDFCNAASRASFAKYPIDAIGYSRLILTGARARYFERCLATRKCPDVFKKEAFSWRWSKEKKRREGAKEQLCALHGHWQNGKKWFAWHGLGENQLHFSGERNWWPQDGAAHSIEFDVPLVDSRIGYAKLVDLLEGM